MPLRTVKGMDIRPTTDRTKETLFNIMQFRIPGCFFLDLFAGSGSIGIEALSRGASEAVFVEKDRRAVALVEENLEFTKLADRARVVKGDVTSVLPVLRSKRPFDIIFMDPPFDKELEHEALRILAGTDLIAPDGLVVVEVSPKTDMSYVEELGYVITDSRHYSGSAHIFLKKA